MRGRLGSMPRGALLVEAGAGVAEQGDRLEHVVGHHRLVDVELEVALAAGHRHRGVVAEHLHRHHGQRLGLGRVHLARHDARARFVGRDVELADAVAGPDAYQRTSLAIFISAPASVRSAPLVVTRASWALSDAKRVGRLHERVAGEPGQLGGGLVTELRVGVEAGADRGAADGQLEQAALGVTDLVEGGVDLVHPTADDLAERDRRGVLEVGATDHDDVGELVGLGVRACRGAG